MADGITKVLEELTEIEGKVLAILHTSGGSWFGYGHCYYAHDHILDGGDIFPEGIHNEVGDRKGLSKVLKSLRDKDLVRFMRGLMTEDGEVAGSGNAPNPVYEDDIEKFVEAKGWL